MSVVLGWFLARHGFADLEGAPSCSVIARRIIAAVSIVVAMLLYASR